MLEKEKTRSLLKKDQILEKQREKRTQFQGSVCLRNGFRE